MTAGGGRTPQTNLKGGLNINQVQLKALYLHQGFPPTGLRGKPLSLDVNRCSETAKREGFCGVRHGAWFLKVLGGWGPSKLVLSTYLVVLK